LIEVTVNTIELVQVAQGLANVFCTFLMSEEFNEDRTVTAMGIMGTLENIISVMEDHKEVRGNTNIFTR
jgi:hypothetical protein